MIKTGLGRKIVVVLVVVAIVIAASYLISRWAELGRREVPTGVQQVPEETRSVTLFFAGQEADRLVAETREVAAHDAVEAQIKAVMNELVRGSDDNDKVSTMPPGTRVLQVFWDEELQTVYLDLNRSIVSNHPGGSAGEYFTISSVVKTIGANFPQVRQIQFLVDGYPVETIAGHYAVDKPIDVLKWQ